MNTFCTNCGSAVPPRASHRWRWILALMLFFALGVWLGLWLAPKGAHCPLPPAAGAGGSGGGGGGGGGGGQPKRGAGGDGGHNNGGGGGSGTGRVLGDGGRSDGSGGGGAVGSGSGSGDRVGGGGNAASGTTVGHGYDGSATGAGGSDDGGGGSSGKPDPGAGTQGPQTDPDAAKRTESGVWRLAAGAPLSEGGLDAPAAQGNSASTKVLSAPDFRYDKSGLPHYPDGNTAVFSALSYDVEGRTDRYGSSSGILTTSAFDDVVNWYRKNLPAGWSSTTVGDFNQLGAVAQQLSPEKIMQMLTAPSEAGTKSVGETPATAAADRLRLSLFKPPAAAPGVVGLMISQKGDKPVEIMTKIHVGS